MPEKDVRWREFSIRRLRGRHGFDLCLRIEDEVHVWRFAHGLPYNSAAPRKATYREAQQLDILEREGPTADDGEPALIWDRGRYLCEDDPVEGLRRGKLRVELVGYKARGGWALGRGKGTWRGRGRPWIPSMVWDLVKVPDEFAGRPAAQSKTSVLSNLDIDDVDGAMLKDDVERLIKAAGARRGAVDWRKAPAMQEPGSTVAQFSAEGWLFELRRAGLRVLAARFRSRGAIVSADGSDLTQDFPELTSTLASVPLSGLVIEGSVVTGDYDAPPTLFAADILACSGRDLRPAALVDRKAILARIFSGSVGAIRYSDHIETHGEALCAEVRAGKAVGCTVVARRADSAWVAGPCDAMRAIEMGATLEDDGIARPAGRQTGTSRARMSNRDKIFWPDEGITKGQLLDYYSSVAGSILPYLHDRPLVLTRFPDGIEGKSFFQHHAPGAKSAWLRTVRISTSRRPRDYFVVEDHDDLIYLINLGTIPLHVWPSRASSLELPDWCTIDIDRSEASWEDVIEVALALRELCESIDLPCFVKTSGGDGLHVCIPLAASIDYDRSRLLAELLARTIEDEHPLLATTEGLIARRGGKVYLDHLVNARGRMLVSPLSARARPGATVSTPLSWSEVDVCLDPGQLTIGSVPPRLAAQTTDPWEGFLDTRPDLASALEELAARMPG